MTLRGRRVVIGALGIGVAILGFGVAQLPAIGAGALLHPARQRVVPPPPRQCEDTTFAGAGVALRGWVCHTAVMRRGTIVVLHGVADNRGGAAGIIDRYLPRGFDLVAYDSRAHGESGGDACTYGFFEKDDLKRIIDTIGDGPVVLLGTSLGAAVALQEAADDPRVIAAVAAESFSDLRTVAQERAPIVFTPWSVTRAFELAEQQGRFHVDDVSPVRAASRLSIPVLLIHGAEDVDTPPDHSRRIYAALKGPKRLILVPGSGHNHSLQASVWPEIDAWIDRFTS